MPPTKVNNCRSVYHGTISWHHAVLGRPDISSLITCQLYRLVAKNSNLGTHNSMTNMIDISRYQYRILDIRFFADIDL